MAMGCYLGGGSGMSLSVHTFADENVKTIANHISGICLSKDFQGLKQELESLYCQSGIDNPGFIAFHDALYTMLTQEESTSNRKIESY